MRGLLELHRVHDLFRRMNRWQRGEVVDLGSHAAGTLR